MGKQTKQRKAAPEFGIPGKQARASRCATSASVRVSARCRVPASGCWRFAALASGPGVGSTATCRVTLSRKAFPDSVNIAAHAHDLPQRRLPGSDFCIESGNVLSGVAFRQWARMASRGYEGVVSVSVCHRMRRYLALSFSCVATLSSVVCPADQRVTLADKSGEIGLKREFPV